MSRTAFVTQTVVCCGSRIFFCRKTPCPSCPSSPKKPFVHSEPSSCLPSCAHVQKGLRLCIYIYINCWNLKPDMSCMLHANYLTLLDAQMISMNWWPCNKLHNIYINIFPPHWPLKKGRSKTSKLRRHQQDAEHFECAEHQQDAEEAARERPLEHAVANSLANGPAQTGKRKISRKTNIAPKDGGFSNGSSASS